MLTFPIIKIAFVFTCITVLVGALSADSASYKKHDGYKIIGNPISVIEGDTKTTCIAKCTLQNGCFVANFILVDGNRDSKCQLFDFHRTEHNFIEDGHSTVIQMIEKDYKWLEQEISLIGLPCEQIDTYQGKYVCTFAIDEHYDTQSCNHDLVTCIHTVSSIDPWWQVDLESRKTVTKVMIYNRIEDPEMLHNIEIRVQDQPMPRGSGSGHCVKDIPYVEDLIRTLKCFKPVTGRYLVVQKGKPDSRLTLMEVRAFGY